MDQSTHADIGDYLKVFACSAVMLQTVLAFVLSTGLTHSQQIGVGLAYNLVKFAAPAFIFGILYTTTRTHPHANLTSYPHYLHKQWSVLFVPTICWTFIYLFTMPQLQQQKHFTDLLTFCWQFINGNAAPHLWYNTMMLQFIILMPIFWKISQFVDHSIDRCRLIIFITTVIFALWIAVYDQNVFHGQKMQSWYLFDRIFLSFGLYAVLGTLTWNFHEQLSRFLKNFWWIFLIGFGVVYYWTNQELFKFGFPVKLYNATYYKPSMILYSLSVIALIISFACYQIRKHKIKSLTLFHWLAIYAHRAFLSHVFWLELFWIFFGKAALKDTQPAIVIIILYIFTWLLAFASAYDLHVIWSKIKTRLKV